MSFWTQPVGGSEGGGKSSRVELLTIQETIKLLTDDDAIVLFKANLPSASLVEAHQSTAAVGRRMMDELRRSSRTPSNSGTNVKVISLAFSGKKVDLLNAIWMIDEMVTLTKGELNDKVVEVPVMLQRQVLAIQKVQKTVGRGSKGAVHGGDR